MVLATTTSQSVGTSQTIWEEKGSSSNSSQNHSVLWWNKTSLLSQIFGPFWHQKNARQSLSFTNITWAFAVQSKMAFLSLPSTGHQSTKKFSRSQASSTTRSRRLTVGTYSTLNRRQRQTYSQVLDAGMHKRRLKKATLALSSRICNNSSISSRSSSRE